MIRFFLLLLTGLPFYTFSQSLTPVADVRVQIYPIVGYGESESFAREAIAILQQVVNSQAFKDELLERKMYWRMGLSNQEIYDRIRFAHEVKGPGGEDGVLDLRIRTINGNDHPKWLNKNCLLDSRAGTIGLDGNGDGVMAICPQRLRLWAEKNDLGSLAGHYMHEYMHILGFKHRWPFKYSSAVYEIGYIVRDLVNKSTASLQRTKQD